MSCVYTTYMCWVLYRLWAALYVDMCLVLYGLCTIFSLCYVCCNDEQCSVVYCELFALCDEWCTARVTDYMQPAILLRNLCYTELEEFQMKKKKNPRLSKMAPFFTRVWKEKQELISDKFKCSSKTNTKIMFQKKKMNRCRFEKSYSIFFRRL